MASKKIPRLPARFPAVKSSDEFDFPAIPSVNKALVWELAQREILRRRRARVYESAECFRGAQEWRMQSSDDALSQGPFGALSGAIVCHLEFAGTKPLFLMAA